MNLANEEATKRTIVSNLLLKKYVLPIDTI